MVELPEELRNRQPRKEGQEPTARLTIDAYNRLKAELADLIENGRPYISERIKVAREHGDIRENSEYDAAKNEQGLMESKIRKLQQMLRDPDIVEAPTEADAVGPGMLVTVRPIDDDDDGGRDVPPGRARRGEGVGRAHRHHHVAVRLRAHGRRQGRGDRLPGPGRQLPLRRGRLRAAHGLAARL